MKVEMFENDNLMLLQGKINRWLKKWTQIKIVHVTQSEATFIESEDSWKTITIWYNEVVIDKSQIIGEVKERNKLYKALVKVQEIANKSLEEQKTESVSCLNEIEKICAETLKNII